MSAGRAPVRRGLSLILFILHTLPASWLVLFYVCRFHIGLRPNLPGFRSPFLYLIFCSILEDRNILCRHLLLLSLLLPISHFYLIFVSIAFPFLLLYTFYFYSIQEVLFCGHLWSHIHLLFHLRCILISRIHIFLQTLFLCLCYIVLLVCMFCVLGLFWLRISSYSLLFLR
ncbi:MAG: hypothetical protein [Microviridae sp.]|nr:MAG: hypothetical protein [Microviridae sp.]